MGERQHVHLPLSLFIVLFAVSLSLNVQQALKLRKFEIARTPRENRVLPVGSPIPPMQVSDVETGLPTTIAYQADRPTVLYFFSPACGWCAKNEQNMATLTQKRGSAYRFIGLSLSDKGVIEYAKAHTLPFPVYVNIAPAIVSALGLGSTPDTLVVSSKGKLLRQWKGAFTKGTQAEVEAFFGVSLPGLTAQPASQTVAAGGGAGKLE